MGYHDLSGSSLDADERRAEADRLTQMIGQVENRLTKAEKDFVQKQRDGFPVSVKQIFFLRDIWSKYQ